MSKVGIGNLVIEVTRRCNMDCDHCLRGDAETADLKDEYLEALLKGCDGINGVTFTGGEPSLNVKAIEKFIEIVTREKIDVGYFYIATNGKHVSEEFFLVCARLYALCYDNEMSGVQLSNDDFHQTEYEYGGGLLQAFKFFSPKENKEDAQLSRYRRRGEAPWINEGRYADDYGDGRELSSYPFEIEEEFISDGEIYLNCEGNVIAGCDWSYESQRDPDNIVCKAGDDLLAAAKAWNARKEIKEAANA